MEALSLQLYSNFSLWSDFPYNIDFNENGSWSFGLARSLCSDISLFLAVIKQRMQVYGSPYRNTLHCALTVFRKEGILAFYRSYTTQITMNIPFQCTNFIVYEAFRQKLNPGGQYDPRTHILAGGAAGIIASAATTPLDVAKTLLNTQEATVRSDQHHIRGMFNALRIIYHQSGVFGFFKGMWPRIIYQMPATAICWSVYELFKHLLKLDTDHTQACNLN